jgi:hypothetical protein
MQQQDGVWINCLSLADTLWRKACRERKAGPWGTPTLDPVNQRKGRRGEGL